MRPLWLDACFIIKVDFNSPKGLSLKSVAPCIVILVVAMGKWKSAVLKKIDGNVTLIEHKANNTCGTENSKNLFWFLYLSIANLNFLFLWFEWIFVALVKACVLKCIGIIKVWLSIAAFYSLNSLFHKGCWLYFQMYVYFSCTLLVLYYKLVVLHQKTNAISYKWDRTATDRTSGWSRLLYIIYMQKIYMQNIESCKNTKWDGEDLIKQTFAELYQ